MPGRQLAEWLTHFLHKAESHWHDGSSFARADGHACKGGSSGSRQGPLHGAEPDIPAGSGTGKHAEEATADEELRVLGEGTVRIDLLNNNNSQYYGDFTVGDSGQRFTGVFDTGSSITWVPGSKCQSKTCLEHHRYEVPSPPSKASSSTAAAIHYGTGEVKLDLKKDGMAFCDSHDNAGCRGRASHKLEVHSQPFGTATEQTSYPFRILPFDGILGLAPSANPGSVLHQLKASKALPRNVLGVYLSEDTHRSGSIAFGGVEPQHIAKGNPVHWHRIQSPAEWRVEMRDIIVNGKPLHLCDGHPGKVCPAVVDTGSSLVTGPTNEIEKLLSKISMNHDCRGFEKMPEVDIQLVDNDGEVVNYPLTPSDYVLRTQEEVQGSGDAGYFKEFPLLGKGGKAPDIQDRCEPGIGVMDVPGSKWVLGDTFLRRYYSIYDDDRGLVGLVRSVHPDETPATLPAAAPMRSATTASLPAPLGLAAPLLAGCRRRTPPRERCSVWARFL